MNAQRKETDSLGEMLVDESALHGAHTARAVANFPISGWRMPRRFIAALGLIKQAAAVANGKAGRLDKVTKKLAAAGVNIHSAWGTAYTGKTASCIFLTSDDKKAIAALKK